MPQLPKTNKITFINAIKGSGKTMLAHALALAQSKRVIWLTPIKSGYYPHKLDLQNEFSFIISPKQAGFYCVDLESFDEFIKNVIVFVETQEPQGVFLVIDELDIYSSARISNQSALYELINTGRHYRIDITAMCRRNQDIPKTLITNCDYFIYGKNNLLQNDIKHLKDFLNESDIEAIRDLNNGDFIRLNLNTRKKEFLRLDSTLVRRIESYAKNLK